MVLDLAAQIAAELDAAPPLLPKLAASVRQLLLETESPQQSESYDLEQSEPFEIQMLLQRGLLTPRQLATSAANYGLLACASALPPRSGTPTGDFYYAVPQKSGVISFLVGDCCGHDSPDAWDNSIRIGLFLRTPQFSEILGQHGSKAGSLLSALDEALHLRGSQPMRDSASMTYVRYDSADRRVDIASAAMPHPWIVRADGRVEKIRLSGGFISNPLSGVCFSSGEFESFSTTLDVGDTLVMFTDGVSDARTSAGTCAEQELPALLALLPGADVMTFVSRLQELSDGSFDDRAILVIQPSK